MYLDKLEERMLVGDYGESIQLAMEILTGVGDIYRAEEMTKIASAHTVMTPYRDIMDAGVEICEKFAGLGTKYSVPTTLDPAGMDLQRWREFKIPETYAKSQMKIVKAQEKLGGIPVWTCTPYLHGNAPLLGQHVGWSESSAVVFANSVLGAKTNRLTAVVDMAAGIAGRVPKFGLHLDENRRGEILVRIKVKPKTLMNSDYPAIGYFIGKQVADKVPVLNGFPKIVSTDQLKNMGAAAAASGSLALYHMPGVTPECERKNLGRCPDKMNRKETLELSLRELRETKEEMCTTRAGKVDFIAVGCPHYSISELGKVAALLRNRKIHKRIKFWIYTTKHVEMLAKRMGYFDVIESSGAQILTETCMLVSPTDIYGFETMMTDSGKCAYYAPALCKAEVIYESIEQCVKAAIKGFVQ